MANKTFQEIQVEIANIFRSSIDPDDMALDNQTEEEYLNVASSCYTVAKRLLNENTFPFNVYQKEFSTSANRNNYNGVDGQIVKDGVTVEENTLPLRYENNWKFLREQTGRPTKFWLDNNEKIYLYPTPDESFKVNVKYKDMRYFLDANRNPVLEPEPTATLRMPERLQGAFIDWLKYETLVNYIKNLAKPRYQPLIDEANKLKLAFLKLVYPYSDEARFIL